MYELTYRRGWAQPAGKSFIGKRLRSETLHEIFYHLKTRPNSFLFLLVAFFAGCFVSGLYFSRHRFADLGELNQRYYSEHRGATETVRKLENELERERELNRQLRENNTRARSIAGELTVAAERNVRNLQDAIALIGEIRAKLKVLADFYNNSDPGDGGD